MSHEHPIALLVGGDLAQRTGTLLQEKSVHCVGVRRSAQPANGPVQWIQANLHDPDSLSKLPAHVDYLLYAVTPDQRTEQAYRSTYVEGLRNLARALDVSCLKRAVFVSSTAVYGSSSSQPVDENTPEHPEGFNGRVLLQAERVFREWLAEKAVVLRLSGIYGPQRMQLLQRLASGQVQPASADQWTNRIHIDDAAGACAHLLLLPEANPVYIGTDDTPMRMSVLYGQLAAMVGAKFAMAPDTHNQPLGKALRNQRLKSTGYTLKWPDSLKGYRAILTARKL
jgi:nucleoside-diphosphate-sugar epimerase